MRRFELSPELAAWLRRSTSRSTAGFARLPEDEGVFDASMPSVVPGPPSAHAAVVVRPVAVRVSVPETTLDAAVALDSVVVR